MVTILSSLRVYTTCMCMCVYERVQGVWVALRYDVTNHFFNCYDLPNVILFYYCLQFRFSSYATDKQIRGNTWGKRWKWSWKTSEKSLQNCIAKGLYSFPLSEQHDARFNSVRKNSCFLGMCTITDEAMATPCYAKVSRKNLARRKIVYMNVLGQ